MTEFIIYILKSSLALGLLYGLYFLLFRRETLYHFNRIYILGALVVSLVLPALNIQLSQPLATSINKFDYVNHAFIDINETMQYVKVTTEEKVTTIRIIPYIVLIGMLMAASRVGFQLISIYKNINKYELKQDGKYKYVLIDQYYSTHSFFNYIFVQKSEIGKRGMHEVLVHEKMHADQRHSIDLLLIGFLSILHWFNPFIYLFKRALVETHEFQADQAVISQGIDKDQYQRLLLQHARSVVMTGLTSSFNQSIIKNRLKMMNKIKSNNRATWKYILAFPVVFFVGIVFAISQEKIDTSIVEVFTITSNGEIIKGTSDFAVIDVSDEKEASFKADKMYTENGEDLYLEGNISINSVEGIWNVIADNVVYRENERKLYAYSDDYVPSILPLDEKKLKRKTSGFGMRMHPILKVEKMHNGCDFSAPAGTEIYSTANGTVRKAQYFENYGNRVIIDHGNGFSTSYSQMESYNVEPDQSVKRGEVIGYVGSSGLSTAPHLHYEVMKDGKYVDPEDYLGNKE